MADYRDKIYERYVTARDPAFTPASIEGMRPRAPFLSKLIRDHFPVQRDARIVELGCGYGALLHFARLAGYTNLLGIDRSPEQVEAATKLGITVQKGDLMQALDTMPIGSVDAFIAFDVIEHFRKDELVLFLAHAYRALKPEGKMIVHIPNGESPFGMASFFNDFTHEVCFNHVSIAQVFRTCGFSEVHSYEDTPVIHGTKSAVRWLLWKVIRGGLRLWTAAETGDLARDGIFTRNFIAVAHKQPHQ